MAYTLAKALFSRTLFLWTLGLILGQSFFKEDVKNSEVVNDFHMKRSKRRNKINDMNKAYLEIDKYK